MLDSTDKCKNKNKKKLQERKACRLRSVNVTGSDKMTE